MFRLSVQVVDLDELILNIHVLFLLQIDTSFLQKSMLFLSSNDDNLRFDFKNVLTNLFDFFIQIYYLYYYQQELQATLTVDFFLSSDCKKAYRTL